MDGLGGMKEVGRGPGRSEGGRQLLPDKARFPHSRDDDVPRAVQKERNRVTERRVERLGLRGDRGALLPKNISGDI